MVTVTVCARWPFKKKKKRMDPFSPTPSYLQVSPDQKELVSVDPPTMWCLALQDMQFPSDNQQPPQARRAGWADTCLAHRECVCVDP